LEHGERLRKLSSRVHGRAEEEQGQGLAALVLGTPVEVEAVPVGFHRAGRIAAVEVAAVELLDGRARQHAVGGLGEGHGAFRLEAGALVLAEVHRRPEEQAARTGLAGHGIDGGARGTVRGPGCQRGGGLGSQLPAPSSQLQ
jgi:hypothetical protein